MSSTTSPLTKVVLKNGHAGHVEIQATGLTRLNYHDGMFLRAASLKLEQQYVRRLSAFSNQADGAGIVHGFDCTVAGGNITVGPGLAIDFQGRVLRLVESVSVGLDDLIAKSRNKNGTSDSAGSHSHAAGEFTGCELIDSDVPLPAGQTAGLYLVTIGYAEAACGQSEVYGDPCQQPCKTEYDYANVVEGVILRAVPLDVPLKIKTYPNLSQKHFRSQVASAYFDWEQQQIPNLVSKFTPISYAWCAGATELEGGEIAIALLSRGSSKFLDVWTVRRERMVSPPAQYWAHRLAMRPWNVFLAQVLQFQCQLAHCFQEGPPDMDADPCRKILDEAARMMAEFIPHYAEVSKKFATSLGRDEFSGASGFKNGLKRLTAMKSKFESLTGKGGGNRWLINCGIVEVPSAGYLPVVVDPKLSVNQQVRLMMGEGVDLRFCVVQPDYVPHALEEAQHMRRISLVHGLHNPQERPPVDVLVPNGEIQPVSVEPVGTGYDMTLDLYDLSIRLFLGLSGAVRREGVRARDARVAEADLVKLQATKRVSLRFRGAARDEQTASGGYAMHFAGIGRLDPQPNPELAASTLVGMLNTAKIWTSLESERDPFTMRRLEFTNAFGEVAMALGDAAVQIKFNGKLKVEETDKMDFGPRVRARLTGSFTSRSASDPTSKILRQVMDDVVIFTRRETPGEKPRTDITFPSVNFLGSAGRTAVFKADRHWSSSNDAMLCGNLELAKLTQWTTARMAKNENEYPMYFANQKIDATVLLPNHVLHGASVSAIRGIAEIFKDKQFEEYAVYKLFPPMVPSSNDLVIHAREDWVLFHRRREKQCSQEPPTLPGVSPRKFRVYAARLAAIEQAKELDAALRASDAVTIAKFKPVEIDVVEFAAGIPTLQSLPEEVLAEWKLRVPAASSIAYGAVARVGDALDETLELTRSRLLHLSGVLGAATPVSADAQFEILAKVPDVTSISAAPHDGLMILAVVSVATECQEVYRFDGTQNSAEELFRKIPNTGAAQIVPKLLSGPHVARLGHAEFRPETGELIDRTRDEIQQAWLNNGGGDVKGLIVISQRPKNRNRVTAAERKDIDRYKNQAVLIGNAVGGAIPLAEVLHESPEDNKPLEPCPAITVIVAGQPEEPPRETVCNEVIVVKVIEGGTNAFLEKVRNGGLIDFAQELNRIQKVSFVVPTNQPVDESLDNFMQAWNATFPANVQRPDTVVAVSSRFANPDDHNEHKEQSKLLKDAVNIPGNLIHIIDGSRQQFPSECPAVTLAILRIIG